MQQRSIETSSPAVLSAWRQQVAHAAQHPTLRQQLLHQERTLLPRFAAYLLKLRRLPRRERRTLQRKWKKSLGKL